MKYLNLYILAGALLGGICLTSCNEDDFIKNEEAVLPSQPDDIPEGYARVSFSCGNNVQTRVATGDVSNYVSYVDAYIYEDDGGGNYKLINKGFDNIYSPSSDPAQWPLKYVKELMKGHTYKAVFLGNVNNTLFGEQVLSGVEEGKDFMEAEIHRPVNTEFSGNNLFYIAVTSPFTVQDGMQDVSVTLKRIVTGHTIANYGFEGTGGDLEQIALGMLAEGQPLGDQIFGGQADADKTAENKSLLWKQFHHQLLKDFMFPAAYMLKKNSKWTSSGTAFDQWWAENESSFWNNYNEAAKLYVDNNWSDIRGASWLFYVDNAKPIQDLIINLYTNKDNCIDWILAAVKTKDIPIIGENGVAAEKGTYTLAKKSVATKLAEALNSTSLFPFKISDKVTITLSKIPTAIGFDLHKKEEDLQIKQTATASSSGTLDFFLLGTKTEGFTFDYSSIHKEGEVDVNLPQEFPGQSLEPNVRTTYRIAPTEGSLQWNGKVNNQEEISLVISYNTIINAIVESGISSLSAKDLHNETNGTIQTQRDFAPFRASLMTAYYLFDYNTNFHITPKTGQADLGVMLSLGGNFKQSFMSMPTPDFTNLNVDAHWTYESSKNEIKDKVADE